MSKEYEQQDILQFAEKIGFDIGKNLVKNIEVRFQKTCDFLPELAVFMASYLVKKTSTRQTIAPRSIKDNVCFFFQNVFNDEELTAGKEKINAQELPPYIHIYPSTLSHKSVFRKDAYVKVVAVIISADYLKSFLRDDASSFQFLFDRDNNFLIEEIMTDDIVRTVNDMVRKEEPGTLKSYYYKMKAMELLFFLFQSLGKRERSVYQKLTGKDIASIYKVRDKLISSLNKPCPVFELKQIAGMNELKMRQIFTQVFGKGIYDYYQHLRMTEAARLLRDKSLSVSDVGYRMGFENLSHFSRVFEKHIGKKPKQYSKELT